MKNLKAKDLEDIITGASFFGSGGGGDIGVALGMIGHVKFPVKLAKFSEIEGIVPCVYSAGSMATKYIGKPLSTIALSNMEKHLKIKIGGVIPVEIGPLSLIDTIVAASVSGVPILDSDISGGRAFPEITNSLYFINGLPISPVSIATSAGEFFIQECVDKFIEEKVLSLVKNNGICSVADHPLIISKIVGILTEGSITKCLELGKSLRTSTNSESAIKKFGGRVVFSGVIKSVNLVDTGRFLIGNYSISGSGCFLDKEMRIDVKNENLLARVDNKVIISTPDIMSVTDLNYNPILTNRISQKQEVIVLVFEGNKKWKSKLGLGVVGPRAFGFDMDYVNLGPLNEKYDH